MEPAREWEPMHEHVSRVESRGDGQWHISNIRDFIFTPDAPPVYRWSETTIDIAHVTNAHFYTFPLEQFGNLRRLLFAHTCIGFSFTDGTNLLYSIEVRQPLGKEYRPSSNAENVRIFATLEYFCGFRHVVRKRGFSRYPILLPQEKIKNVLQACLRDAADAYDTVNHYHAVTNQCTTALIRAMNRGLEKPIPWHPWLHLTGLTHRVLAKRCLINLAHKETL